MSVLPVGFGGASGSYSITNSARFNGTSDYLSKTLTTSATTSGSIWVKRSKLGAISPIFDNKVYFTSGDALYAFGLTSTALYRDPSAWMHIFWNSTGVYVNGALITGTGSYTPASVANPRLGYDGTNYFSGYFSDFAFWDGTSASLHGGATNSDGVWAARRPSAGYSFLAFGSSGALGTDTSGNGNNWTVNGSPAQTTDTPTNNYCTLNPLAVFGSTATLSNGNLTAAFSGVGTTCVPGTQVLPTKWYFESEISALSYAPAFQIGVITQPQTAPLGMQGGAGAWCANLDGVYYANGANGALSAAFVAGDVIMLCGDMASGKWWIGKNGAWLNSGNPSTGANPITSDLTFASSTPSFGQNSGLSRSATFVANFGETTLFYTPPTGFLPPNTSNMTSAAVTTSGTFDGNVSADGPFIWANGNHTTLDINGNAVTFGTHADKTAGGFKLRTSSAAYNTSGSNTWTATAGKRFVYSATSINTAQGNP